MKNNHPLINQVGFLKLPAPDYRSHHIPFMSSLKRYVTRIYYRQPPSRSQKGGSRVTGRYHKIFYLAYMDEERNMYPGHYPAPHPEDASIPSRFVCPHGRLVAVGECKDAKKGVRVVFKRPLVPGILLKQEKAVLEESGNPDANVPGAEGALYVYVLSSDGASVPIRVDLGLGDQGEALCHMGSELQKRTMGSSEGLA